MAAYYTFEDYSGTSTPNTSDNPYDGLIENCKNDPVRTQFYNPCLCLTHMFAATNPSYLQQPQDQSQRAAKVETPVPRLPRRHDR